MSYGLRLQNGRVSRRRLLRAAGAGAIAAAALTAGRRLAGVRADGPPAGTPHYGGRVQTAGSSVSTLDPHAAFDGWPARIYNTLVARSAMDASFFFFDLAESLEQPDETTWVFSIRPGVQVAPNGLGIPERDLDAADAYWSFNRIMTRPDFPYSRFILSWFDTHEAPDAQHYVVTTPSPYSYFLNGLGSPVAVIPPRELILQYPTLLSRNGVGGGPFSGRLVWNSIFYSDLVLDRNPNYYRRDVDHGDAVLPYVDGWDHKFVPDRDVRRARFEAQHTHSYGAAALDEALELLGQYDVYDIAEPVNTFISLTLNVKRGPWADPRIRKAALHALNRQEYIDLIYGGDAQANGLVHWPLAKFALPESELDQLQPYDPDMSRQLIKEATGLQMVDINLMYPVTDIEQHDKHLPIFRQQMQAAGFNLHEDVQDFTTWLSNYQTKNYDASLAPNAIYDTPEAPLDFQHSAGLNRLNQFSNGLQDTAIDAAIDAAKAIVVQDDLVAAVQDLQRQIYAAGPAFIPIVSPWNRTLYWNFVQNVPKGLGGAGLFRSDLWLEEGAPGRAGDANCSGEVDSLDALLALQRDAGFIDSLPCEAAADVNRDGSTNAIDALLMLQNNAGLIQGLL